VTRFEEQRIMMRWLRYWLILCLALSVFLSMTSAVSALPDEAVGHVVSVISGDSLGIEMLIADARTNSIDSIKLADIEAPSTVTAEGKAAAAYAVSLLKNKTVYLDIEDNRSRARSLWSQLYCVVYLMDSDFRPLWPPVNRILVDAGHASVNDDPNNEFNSSDWWQDSPSFSAGEMRDRFLARLQGASSSGQEGQAATSPAAGTTTGTTAEEPRKVSVLETDSKSGGISIGYRK
jgi:endonuclease YncB( thermonuclease family)